MNPLSSCGIDPMSVMTHPGLSGLWIWVIFMSCVSIGIMIFWQQSGTYSQRRWLLWTSGGLPAWLKTPWLLLSLRFIVVFLFVLVIISGLWGTPVPEHNLATVLTWNIWWAGLILVIFLLGNIWCSVCPWDSLASWFVGGRLWKRGSMANRLNLKVPKIFRNIWPALLMFIGLTWLELGIGITTSPKYTAWLAVFMFVFVVISLILFERKAFCRYFCPVGRTIGCYAQLAPVALRPIEPSRCISCNTLECYYGNESTDPCPTALVMGNLKQNTYCTGCALCVRSCPHSNVSWELRPLAQEAITVNRPRLDEAGFIVILVALTTFHGVTMMPFWEGWMIAIGDLIGDKTRQQLWSFSIGLVIFTSIPVLIYALFIGMIPRGDFKRDLMDLAYSLTPLALCYHLAHNMNHLLREGGGVLQVLLDPLGWNITPLTLLERHVRQLPVLSDQTLYALQSGLMILAFGLSMRIFRRRAFLAGFSGWQYVPVGGVIVLIMVMNVWLLSQPMVMRM